MANKISGKIQYLNEKDTQYGKSYNIKVDGSTYYLKGKFPPRGIDAGDFVEFEYETKGNYMTVSQGTLRKTEASTAPPTDAPAKQEAFKTASSYGDRQDVISKQWALNAALELVKFAAEQGTLPVPAKKNEGFGYLKTIWFQEAATLFSLVNDKGWELPETDVEEKAPKPVKKTAKKAVVVEEEFEDDALSDLDDSSPDDNW